jgi:hypothetical protein
MSRVMVVVLATSATLLAGIAAPASTLALPEFLPNPEGLAITLSGTSGAGQLQIQGGGTVKCEKDKVLGELLTFTHLDINVHFEGCKAIGFQANSVGDSAGIILVKGLALLCYINKALKTVGLNVEVTPTLQIEVPTAHQKVEVKGKVIGEVKPVNVKQSTSEVVFTQKEGKPGIEKCEGEPAAVLLAKEAAKEFKPAGEETSEKVTFLKLEATIELEVMA